MPRTKKTSDTMDSKEEKGAEASSMHHVPPTSSNTVVLRLPKPNAQIVVLGLVAVITLFQTFQLMRIGAKANTTVVKTAPASSTQTSTGTDANAPQSMVGGC